MFQRGQISAGIANAALQDGQNLQNWTGPGGGITVYQLCAMEGAVPQTCSTQWGSRPPQNTIYDIQVRVTGVFSSLLNYPGIPSLLSISGSATMRVATQ